MAERRTLALSALRIDEHNPRLSVVNAGQAASLQDLAKHEGRKLLVLAKDIIEFGLNLADLPIVLPDKRLHGKYIVLDGNRRLAALLLLNDPTLLRDAVSRGLRKSFIAASEQYKLKAPITRLLCVVVETRREARHPIILRHRGALDGAGISAWGPVEQSRFEGAADPYRQLLERLVEEGWVPQDTLRKIAPTNFKRIVDTADAKRQLGLKVTRGQMVFTPTWPVVASRLTLIADELYHKRVNVNSLRSKGDRASYVHDLLARRAGEVREAANDGRPTERATDAGTTNTGDPDQQQQATDKAGDHSAKRTTREKPVVPRRTLIPTTTELVIQEARIDSIRHELQTLPVNDFPNCAGVLLRVFLSFSVDHYINTHGVTVHSNSKLKDKLSVVIGDLAKVGRLDPNQERAVRAATQPGSYLATSTTTLNDFVHNPHMSPSSNELRASWEKIEPLFKAIWPT